ncbi:hypothetical protein [Xylocopilactobacillus apicola]|uniref:Lipoprotein n=1 Tax=Xylocopilactobacillus apicola TaxID=2932184 RepID=A0AAU9D8J1_9LACO|nr:hypothetical protein [Xylocopilactobacillus apicola]BDR58706.1 hypothetical protein XA3_11470 [Xylocopilactobacillus apicola]
MKKIKIGTIFLLMGLMICFTGCSNAKQQKKLDQQYVDYEKKYTDLKSDNDKAEDYLDERRDKTRQAKEEKLEFKRKIKNRIAD